MQGFFGMLGSVPNAAGGCYDLLLVARRGTERAGRRYTRRGVDASGHVANYVETEQIVVAGTAVSSFLTLRGSVPVFWSQFANLKYVIFR